MAYKILAHPKRYKSGKIAERKGYCDSTIAQNGASRSRNIYRAVERSVTVEFTVWSAKDTSSPVTGLLLLKGSKKRIGSHTFSALVFFFAYINLSHIGDRHPLSLFHSFCSFHDDAPSRRHCHSGVRISIGCRCCYNQPYDHQD